MRIEFDVTVTTPLFIGGNDSRRLITCNQFEAKQLLTAEGLRVPSLRGAMRFWFRAIAGRVTSDLAEIKTLETRVFGGTSGDATRSAVRIQSWPLGEIDVGQYGVRMNKDERPKRWAIEPGTQFRLAISSHHPQLLRIAVGCLWMVSNFGGVGARTRRGFGGILIEPLSSDEQTRALVNDVLSQPLIDGNENAVEEACGIQAMEEPMKANMLKRKEVKLNEQLNSSLLNTLDAYNANVSCLKNSIYRLLIEQRNYIPHQEAQHLKKYSRLGQWWYMLPNVNADAPIGWQAWGSALKCAREDIYNGFKNHLQLRHIGSPPPQPEDRTNPSDDYIRSTIGNAHRRDSQLGINKSRVGRFASPLSISVVPLCFGGNITRHIIVVCLFDNSWGSSVRLNEHMRRVGEIGHHSLASSLTDYMSSLRDVWRVEGPKSVESI
jgi:CRISPR type III-B/RAMP module RAMP protein Cmr1